MTSMEKTNYNRKNKLKSGLIFAFCVFLTLVCLIPIWTLFCNACRSATQIGQQGATLLPGTSLFENLDKLFNSAKTVNLFNAGRGFLNSAIITFASTFLSIFISCLTAYGFSVYKFKLNDAAFTFILAVLMVPSQVSGLGYLVMMRSVGGYDHLISVILPAMAAPAVVFYLRQYMKSSFPLEIVEAARIDGSGEFKTFIKIGIPMCAPAIAVQAIFAFVTNWNNYFTPSMLISTAKKKTIPMMISALGSNTDSDIAVIYTAIFLSILPLIIIYLIFSRFIVAGVALGGVKE